MGGERQSYGRTMRGKGQWEGRDSHMGESGWGETVIWKDSGRGETATWEGRDSRREAVGGERQPHGKRVGGERQSYGRTVGGERQPQPHGREGTVGGEMQLHGRWWKGRVSGRREASTTWEIVGGTEGTTTWEMVGGEIQPHHPHGKTVGGKGKWEGRDSHIHMGGMGQWEERDNYIHGRGGIVRGRGGQTYRDGGGGQNPVRCTGTYILTSYNEGYSISWYLNTGIM